MEILHCRYMYVMLVPSSVWADKEPVPTPRSRYDSDNVDTNVPFMNEANSQAADDNRGAAGAMPPSTPTIADISTQAKSALFDICSMMIATRTIVLRRGHSFRGICLISSRAHHILKTPAIANAMAPLSRRTHQLMRTRYMSTSEREKAIAKAEDSASVLEKAAANTESITPRPTRRQLRLHCLWEAVPMFTFGE